MKKLGQFVVAWLLLAVPGGAWAQVCHEGRQVPGFVALPGLRYPVVDWRATSGGALPQSHTLAWWEDTIDLTIEDGRAQNVASNQMVITLKLASALIAKKQISGWNPSGFVSTVTAEPGNIGPSSMRITRPTDCVSGPDSHTIVFRKVDWVGSMRDLYYLDIDHLWSNMGGKVLTFTWTDDRSSRNPQYPLKSLVPYEIPVERNLGAVSVTWDRTDVYENRSFDLVHSWVTTVPPTGASQWTQENLGAIGYWLVGTWPFRNLEPVPMTSGPSASTDGAYVNVFTRHNLLGIVHRWSYANQLQWSSWEDLGGVVTSAPASVSWGGSDRVDVFARGMDYAMWHTAWDGSQWAAWTSLGGVFTSGPSAVSRGPNRLDVFGRGTDGAVWMNSWTGTQWTGWSSLGGVITSDPAAVVYGPERIAVFARGTDNALWVRVNNGSGWLTGWGSLGGTITSAPAAVAHPDRIDVFARNEDGEIIQKKWQSPWGFRGYGGQSADSSSSGWGPWTQPPLPPCNGHGC
jgi:hypothetical protein